MGSSILPVFKFHPEWNVWEEEEKEATTTQGSSHHGPIFTRSLTFGKAIVNGIAQGREEFPCLNESLFISKLIDNHQWFALRKILMYLDEKSFKNCKLVCKPLKAVIDDMFTYSKVGQRFLTDRLEYQWSMAFPEQSCIDCKYRVKSVYVDNGEIFCCLLNGRIHVYDKRTRELKEILRHSHTYPKLLAINDRFVISGHGNDTLKVWHRRSFSSIGLVSFNYGIFDLKLTVVDRLVVSFTNGRVKLYQITDEETPKFVKLYHYAPELLRESHIQVDADRCLLFTAMRYYWMHLFCLDTGTVVKSQRIADKHVLSIHLCYPYGVLTTFGDPGDTLELWNIMTMTHLGKYKTMNRILSVALNLKRIVIFTPRGNFVFSYAKELFKNASDQGKPQKRKDRNLDFVQIYGPVCSSGLVRRDIYMDDKVAIYQDKFQCQVRIVDYSNGTLRSRRATMRDLLSHQYVTTEHEYPRQIEAIAGLLNHIKEAYFGIPPRLALC